MFAHCCVLNLKLCSLRQNTVRGSMKNCSGWIIDHQQACVKYTGTMRAVSISRKLTLYVDILQIETSLLKDVDIICQHIALLRPCLNNYLIYWSLPWCCTRAMKLVHLPGGELIKYKHSRHTHRHRHKNLKYSFSGSGLADDVLNIRGSNTTLKIQRSKLWGKTFKKWLYDYLWPGAGIWSDWVWEITAKMFHCT